MLLQVDGSRHDWLEGRGPVLTLVGWIDDATGILTGATFRLQEDAAGYFSVLAQPAAAHGLPLAIYTDQHGIFIKEPHRPPSLAEQLEGKRGTTQVRRALDDAGIGWIGATSPQAKGSIERGWGTAQDRLRSELRRAGATTIAASNEVLQLEDPTSDGVVDPVRRRPTVVAVDECGGALRPISIEQSMDLPDRQAEDRRRRRDREFAGHHVGQHHEALLGPSIQCDCLPRFRGIEGDKVAVPSVV